MINDLINLATLIVIIIYAVFTYKLWKESAKQTKQQLMPLLIVYKKGKDKFFVKNIGNGPALHINLEEFHLDKEDQLVDELTGKEYSIKLKLSEPNILGKDQEGEFFKKTSDTKRVKKLIDPLMYLDPNSSKKEVPLTIDYQDIVGRRYQYQISFGKGHLKMLNLPQEI